MTARELRIATILVAGVVVATTSCSSGSAEVVAPGVSAAVESLTSDSTRMPTGAGIALSDGTMVQLDYPVFAPLLNTRLPLPRSVLAGENLFYLAFNPSDDDDKGLNGRQVLRLRNTSSGKERVVAEGILAFAVAGDGSVGALRMVAPDFDLDSGIGDVEVVGIDPGTTEFTVISDAPGHYELAGWAGDELIVGKYSGPETEPQWRELLAMSTAGVRSIAAQVSFITITPDGRSVIADTLDHAERDLPLPSEIVAIDVATGESRPVLSGLDEERWAEGVGLSGARWTGDTLAVDVGTAKSGGVAVLVWTDGRLEVQWTADYDVTRGGPLFDLTLSEDTKSLVAWTDDLSAMALAGSDVLPAAAFVEVECSARSPECGMTASGSNYPYIALEVGR